MVKHNYGWVQNTSNLSTVRDTVELVPIGGISHNELMLRIHDFRVANGDIKSNTRLPRKNFSDFFERTSSIPRVLWETLALRILKQNLW